MTSFDTDGFLSAEISEFEESVATTYPTKIGLARDANRLTHQIIFSAHVQNEHLPDLLLASLLIRQAESFQGFLILLQKGLLTQAQILLRNLAETMFITGAIKNDATFADRYVIADQVSQKKLIEALVRDMERRGEEAEDETKDRTAELGAATEGITTFSTEQIAQIAQLSSYYDSLYRFTSMAVHTSPRSLDKTLETDGGGKVVSLKYGPIVDELDMYFDYGTSIMLYTLHEIAVHFELPVEDIENLQKQNGKLAFHSETLKSNNR